MVTFSWLEGTAGSTPVVFRRIAPPTRATELRLEASADVSSNALGSLVQIPSAISIITKAEISITFMSGGHAPSSGKSDEGWRAPDRIWQFRLAFLRARLRRRKLSAKFFSD